MTRTERQKECIKKWIGSGGRAIIVCPTGFGYYQPFSSEKLD